MLYQQGDVLIETIGGDRFPNDENLKDAYRWRGDPVTTKVSDGSTLVLAEGEVTGHAHRITADTVADGADAELLQLGHELFLRVLRGEVTVVHEEHNPITIPPGEYVVRKVREYDPFSRRIYNVAD